jgi:hypothetical protein
MRSRLLVVFVGLVSFVAVGCGDDGGTKLVDAKVFLDAPPPMIDAPAVCTTEANLMNLQLGTMAAPAMGDWYQVYTMGPLMGRTFFLIAAFLPGSAGGMGDAMVIELVKPAAGNFPVNQAQNFITDATAMTYTAASYLYGNVNANVMPFTYEQFLFASSGSITLTAVGEADGQLTTGSVSATTYIETNDMTGAPVPAGCMSALGGLTFTLRQMNMPFTDNGGGRSRDQVLQNLLQNLATYQQQ